MLLKVEKLSEATLRSLVRGCGGYLSIVGSSAKRSGVEEVGVGKVNPHERGLEVHFGECMGVVSAGGLVEN